MGGDVEDRSHTWTGLMGQTTAQRRPQACAGAIVFSKNKKGTVPTFNSGYPRKV